MKIIKHVIHIVLSILISYLMVVFIKFDINAINWGADARMACIVILFAVYIFSLMGIEMYKEAQVLNKRLDQFKKK